MDGEPRLTKRERREQRKAEQQQASLQRQGSRRRRGVLIWVIGLLVVGFAAAWVFLGTADDAANAQDIDPIRGPSTATVTIEEFSDFQCPGCKAAQSDLKQLLEEFPNDVQLVYNDFPLRSIHPNGQPAAEAAMCANDQGKYWEYHDTLFEQQDAWKDMQNPRDTFRQYAQEQGLDLDRFTTCLEQRTFKGTVDRDVSDGTRRRINSTPTFFINGEQLTGGIPTIGDWRARLEELGVTAAPAANASTEPTTDTNETP
ncbi:MAG: DsbA family protein [Candidatus Kerfeldbacteria bacterium]|nr:DsbA family protein [Candidatus Kerfeldbacteria bacterium]